MTTFRTVTSTLPNGKISGRISKLTDAQEVAYYLFTANDFNNQMQIMAAFNADPEQYLFYPI
jgi:hypothetical protein